MVTEPTEVEHHLRVSPAIVLRQCATNFEKLAGEFMRGVVSKQDLRQAAAWCYEVATKYDNKAFREIVRGSALGGLKGGAKQARIAHTCSCGRVIYGNGGFAAHRRSCPEYIAETVSSAS
jgi:hypothetical protein